VYERNIYGWHRRDFLTDADGVKRTEDESVACSGAGEDGEAADAFEAFEGRACLVGDEKRSIGGQAGADLFRHTAFGAAESQYPHGAVAPDATHPFMCRHLYEVKNQRLGFILFWR
jgi:hypothetical protein